MPLRLLVTPAAAASLVAAACHGWEGEPPPGAAPLAIGLSRECGLTGTESPRILLNGQQLRIEGGGVQAWARLGEGTAEARISADYLASQERLREDVLEPLVLALMSRRDRTPLHASGFVADGLAIVLAGRSGSGKSCLARAADRAGLQVLSDDTVYVQRHPCLRVWGWPTATHLLPADAPADTVRTRLRNGKLKHVLPLRSARAQPLNCTAAALCVLHRGANPALVRLSAAEALEQLFPLDPGFDLLPTESRDALAALALRGAWQLTLSDDPDAAIRLLVGNVPMLRRLAAQG